MIIDETPLYGRIQVETSPFTTPYSWTDATTSILSFKYSEGGRITSPGSRVTDAGQATIVYRSLASVPTVGSLIRIRRYGTTEYAFVGVISDVAQRQVMEFDVSTTTPVVYTTVYALDWVGYVGQFQLTSFRGGTPSAPKFGRNGYNLYDRVNWINYGLDATGATEFISLGSSSAASLNLHDSAFQGSVLDNLDLAAQTVGAYWYGTHVIPTDNTTGRDGLIEWKYNATTVSSGKTFTDGVGLAGELHYTEIDLESSSAFVVNDVYIHNDAIVSSTDTHVTTYSNPSNLGYGFETIAGSPVLVSHTAFPTTEVFNYRDTTSIATYGTRKIDIDVNAALPQVLTAIGSPAITDEALHHNLCGNPSMEYADTGWENSSNVRVARRVTYDDYAVDAYEGKWAMRIRQTTLAATGVIQYRGTESDGIPVTAGMYYRLSGYMLKGNPARGDTRGQARISWLDNDGTVLSSTSGTATALSTTTWTQLTAAGVAPANAVRAYIRFVTDRTAGGNISVGDHSWLDAVIFHKTSSTTTPAHTYFDGDTANTNSYLYLWTGTPGLSQTIRVTNKLYDVAQALITQYASTSIRAIRIRWNAQESLSSVSSLTVGKTISLKNNGTTATYRIIGIEAEAYRSRYMIDYYLLKI